METIKILTKKAKRTPCTYIGLHKSEPCGRLSVTGICGQHKRWHNVHPCKLCGKGCLSKIDICKDCGYASEYYKQRRRRFKQIEIKARRQFALVLCQLCEKFGSPIINDYDIDISFQSGFDK